MKTVFFSFLDNLDPNVDAIVCVSDYVAHFVEMYLEENPNHFTNSILLTGFDCKKEYSNVINKVTTVDVKNNLLGKRLAMQIEFRMNHPDAPPETSYIRYKIIYSDVLLPSGHMRINSRYLSGSTQYPDCSSYLFRIKQSIQTASYMCLIFEPMLLWLFRYFRRFPAMHCCCWCDIG